MIQRRAAGLLLALILGAVAARVALGDVSPTALLEALREAGSGPLGALAFVGAYLLGTSAFVPAVAFHAAAGVLFGYGQGVAVSLVALNLVSNLHFGLGRVLARDFVEALLARRGLGGLSARVRAEGPWAMAIVRQLPLPFVAVNLAAGASSMRWRHFALGSGLGALPPLLVWTWFANRAIAGVAQRDPRVLAQAALAGACVVALALATRWLSRRRGGL